MLRRRGFGKEAMNVWSSVEAFRCDHLGPSRSWPSLTTFGTPRQAKQAGGTPLLAVQQPVQQPYQLEQLLFATFRSSMMMTGPGAECTALNPLFVSCIVNSLCISLGANVICRSLSTGSLLLSQGIGGVLVTFPGLLGGSQICDFTRDHSARTTTHCNTFQSQGLSSYWSCNAISIAMDDEKVTDARPRAPSSNDEGDMKTVDVDAMKLADMGYTQDMKRNYSIFSILGVGYSLTNSWWGVSYCTP